MPLHYIFQGIPGGVYMFFDGGVLGKSKGQYMFLPQRVGFGGSAKNYLPRIGEFFKPNAIDIFRKDFSKTEDHSTMRKRPGKMIFYIRQFHILNPLNQIIFNGSYLICFVISGDTVAILNPLYYYYPLQSAHRMRIPTLDSRVQGKHFVI